MWVVGCREKEAVERRRDSGQSLRRSRRRRCWDLQRSQGRSCRGKMKKMKQRDFVEELELVDKFLKFGCIIIRILLLLLLLLLLLEMLLPLLLSKRLDSFASFSLSLISVFFFIILLYNFLFIDLILKFLYQITIEF